MEEEIQKSAEDIARAREEELAHQEEQRNITWERNHETILAAYANEMKRTQKVPSISRIAEVTGMNWRTVKAHLTEYQSTLESHPGKLFTDDVVFAMVNEARKGSFFHQRLFFEVFYNLGKKEADKVDNRQVIIQVATTPLSPEDLKQIADETPDPEAESGLVLPE